VFNLYTANDPAIPRELVIDAESGGDRGQIGKDRRRGGRAYGCTGGQG